MTTILDDARLYSLHAKKKAIDLDDVKLSVTMQAEQNFTSPPPRQSLLQLAHTKNTSQLPLPHNKHGLRLPPDRYCLTNCNFKLQGKNKTSGFDFCLQTNYRAMGGGQKNNNKNCSSFSVVAGKMNSPQTITTTEKSQNGTVQPLFKIQVQPNLGPASGLMKRKREEEDYDGN